MRDASVDLIGIAISLAREMIIVALAVYDEMDEMNETCDVAGVA